MMGGGVGMVGVGGAVGGAAGGPVLHPNPHVMCPQSYMECTLGVVPASKFVFFFFFFFFVVFSRNMYVSSFSFFSPFPSLPLLSPLLLLLGPNWKKEGFLLPVV